MSLLHRNGDVSHGSPAPLGVRRLICIRFVPERPPPIDPPDIGSHISGDFSLTRRGITDELERVIHLIEFHGRRTDEGPMRAAFGRLSAFHSNVIGLRYQTQSYSITDEWGESFKCGCACPAVRSLLLFRPEMSHCDGGSSRCGGGAGPCTVPRSVRETSRRKFKSLLICIANGRHHS